MRTDTNRQWTTYRILDQTIDNPDLADPLNLGSTGAGKGLMLWADTADYRVDWDEAGDGGKGSFEFGQDLKGVDVKFFGATTGHYLHWDQSADDLILYGADSRIILESIVDAESTITGSIQTDGGVGIAKKLYVGTNLDVAGTSALDGNVTLEANLYMPSGGVIDFNTADITLTHVVNRLTLAGGSFRIDSTNPIEFNGSGKFIKQLSVNCLQIASDGSGDTTILLSGNTRIAGYFLLYQTDADGTAGGQVWFDTSEQKIKHQMYPAKVITLADVTRAQTFMDNITLSTDKKIQFADSGMYIHQLSATCLRIYSDGSGDSAILLSGNTRIAGYFLLYQTDADGTAGGQVWFDTSEQKIKHQMYPAKVITLADVTRAQTFMDNITLDSDKKVCFGGAGKYIHELSANALMIASDGVGESAILLNANTRIGGYLNLLNTDTDGTVTGQMWFDASESKIKYRIPLAKTITVADVTRAQTFLDDITLNSDKKLYFGGTGKHIYEYTANCLRIVSDGVGDTAILVTAESTRFAGFLLLFDTATEGATNGQIWYDSTDNKFKGRKAGATVEITTT